MDEIKPTEQTAEAKVTTQPHYQSELLKAFIKILEEEWNRKHPSHEHFDAALYTRTVALFEEKGIQALYAKCSIGPVIWFTQLCTVETAPGPKEMATALLMKLELMFDKDKRRTFIRHSSREQFSGPQYKGQISERILNRAYKQGDFKIALVFQEDKDKFQEESEKFLTALRATGRAAGDAKVAEDLTGVKQELATPEDRVDG